MTDGLRIADDVVLPLDFVTKTCAILAQRRKGKTYTAAVIAEELVAAKLPFVALDPTGAWWGLRASADGQSEGLPVVVIGGQHGDLPLEQSAGAFIADLVLDHPGYYILDLSLLEGRPAEREFATAFGTRLHRRKMQPGMDFPLHLFVDEADLFVPQEKETKGDVPLLAAYQGIIRRGGIHGLGATLISQRPALVNKSVLTQLDLLILLRLVAGQDQDAVDKSYISRNTGPMERKDVMTSLASLKIGEAWFFEPGEDLLLRAAVRERHTFNSSATPKPGEQRVEPRVLASIDLDSLRDQMADTVERAKETDPTELQNRLRHTENELRIARIELDRRPTGIPVVTLPEPEQIEVPILTDADREAIERLGAAFAPFIAQWEQIVKDFMAGMVGVSDEIRPILERIVEAQAGIGAASVTYPKRDQVRRAHKPVMSPSPPLTSLGRAVTDEEVSANGTLGTPARHFLTTMARFYPMRLTLGQLGVLADRKTRGGSFNTAMRQLRDGGYIDEDGGVLMLSDRGVTEAGVTPEPMTIDRWREVLPVASREVLDVLVEAHPNGLPPEEVAARAGRLPRGGSWNTAIKMLTLSELVFKEGSMLRFNSAVLS